MRVLPFTRVDKSLWPIMSHRTRREDDIKFEAGKTVTAKFVQESPISKVLLAVAGTATTTGAPVFDSRGAICSIDELQFSRSGNRPFATVRGRDMDVVHRIQTGGSRYSMKAHAIGAAQAFHASPVLAFDIGGNTSLLDASRDSSLTLRLKLSNLAAAAGNVVASGGTIAYDAGTVIRPTVYYTDGAPDGTPGGRGVDYLRNHIHYRTEEVLSTRTNQPILLSSERGYHGLTIIAEVDGVRSDAVLNGVNLQRSNGDYRPIKAADLRAENIADLNLAETDWTGVYHLPLARDGHVEDVLSINPTQSMKLIADVTKVPGTVNLIVYEHYFGD